jgi:hypothetical protein
MKFLNRLFKKTVKEIKKPKVDKNHYKLEIGDVVFHDSDNPFDIYGVRILDIVRGYVKYQIVINNSRKRYGRIVSSSELKTFKYVWDKDEELLQYCKEKGLL